MRILVLHSKKKKLLSTIFFPIKIKNLKLLLWHKINLDRILTKIRYIWSMHDI